ncbi:MAG TPA: glycosyltransferase [Rubricoccaceae bacterium]|nr:glycosyltransferase [Rubricoccaceae bacterium]
MPVARSPRIALIGPAWPFRGGIAHFSNRLAQALGEHADVRLLTFSRQYPKLLFPGKTQLETTPWALPHEPARLLDSLDPRSWRKAGRWLADGRPDVVVFVHWLPFFVPAYLGTLRAMRKALKKAGAAPPEVVLFLHNVRPHNRFPLTDPLMRRLIGVADSYLTLSEHVTKDLLAIKPEARVLESFHPIYDIFEPPIPPKEARAKLGLPDRPTALFFGYVRHYKGLDLLVEALPLARAKVDLQVIVAGEFYDDEEAIRKRAADLGLTSGDTPALRFFSDYIPNDEVHLYFSAADVVAQPYRSATPSGVAQTAFFFGKPMIVTDLGVLAEVVPDDVAGYVVPPNDVDALADALVRFFRKGTPERLAAGAAAQGRKYSWDALVAQLLPFLEKRPAPAEVPG